MKTKLTPEQSQRLIKLGVNPSKASEVKEFDDELSRWTHRGSHIFILSDILSLLPKEIILQGTEVQLQMGWNGIVWIAGYDNRMSDYCHFEHNPELIDALFELLCWTLTRETK